MDDVVLLTSEDTSVMRNAFEGEGNQTQYNMIVFSGSNAKDHLTSMKTALFSILKTTCKWIKPSSSGVETATKTNQPINEGSFDENTLSKCMT